MANKKNFGECGTGMVTAPQDENGVIMKYRLADGRSRVNDKVVEATVDKPTLTKLVKRTLSSKHRIVDIELPNGCGVYTTNKSNDSYGVTHWEFTEKVGSYDKETYKVSIPITVPVDTVVGLIMIAATEGIIKR